MSESHDNPAPPAVSSAGEPAAVPPPRRRAGAAAWVAALMLLLVLVIAGVATSPFWAPEIAPLLPWGRPQQYDQLAARVQALEQQVQALKDLAARVAKLESAAGRPDNTAELSARLDRLDKNQQQVASTAAAMQKLDQRLTAVEARPVTPPSQSPEAQQQIETLTGTLKSLEGRLDAVEKAEKEKAGADPTDTGLVLVLLQMRDAVDAGRPFTAEYDAFAALAHDRPKVAGAAAPLAAAAQQGIAGREVLREQLAALAASIANAAPPAAAGDWRAQAWARLRSLVTIRRVGGSGQSAPETAVIDAQRALAQGDLVAAIAKLKVLTGASAEAARPWIQMAEARLNAERALHRVEELLTTGLAAQHRPGQP